MSANNNETAVAQTENTEEQEDLAWTNQSPTTRISGTFEGVIYSGELSDREAQNSTSFGVVFSDPQVQNGELFVNQNKADDGTFTVVDEETGKRATDYRVVDLTDDSVTQTEIQGETFVSDRAGQTFESQTAAGFDESQVIVWYNGMAGQVIARALDFNGRPFAEYKRDGYLVKGLFQVAEGWRNGDKSSMAKNGLAPRVVRAPIPRADVLGDEISIEIGRWNGGRMYEATVTDSRGNELGMEYSENADDILEDSGFRMHLYHGEGFQDKPANAQEPARQFDITATAVDGVEDGEDDSGGLTASQENFIQAASNAAIQAGMQNADDAFNGGIEGLMDQQNVTGDANTIGAEIQEIVDAHFGNDEE